MGDITSHYTHQMPPATVTRGGMMEMAWIFLWSVKTLFYCFSKFLVDFISPRMSLVQSHDEDF